VAILADISAAIDLERRSSTGRPIPLRDLLNRVIAEYNKMVSVKKHRIDTGRKNLIYNLPLGSIISSCSFKHGGFVSCFL
jgi:hypothetical protein